MINAGRHIVLIGTTPRMKRFAESPVEGLLITQSTLAEALASARIIVPSAIVIDDSGPLETLRAVTTAAIIVFSRTPPDSRGLSRIHFASSAHLLRQLLRGLLRL